MAFSKCGTLMWDLADRYTGWILFTKSCFNLLTTSYKCIIRKLSNFNESLFVNNSQLDSDIFHYQRVTSKKVGGYLTY